MRLRIDSHTRLLDDGATIAGGSPYAHWSLNPREHVDLNRWLAGATVDLDDASEADLAHRLLTRGMVQPESGRSISVEEVTVVIPAHNCADRVATTLGLLPNVRIIVVDDGSARPLTLADIREPDPSATHEGRIEVLRCERNKGPGAARNIGLGAVTTRYVAFIDAGIEIAEEPLLQLGAWMHSFVSVVAPRVRSAPGGSRVQRYDRHRSPIDLGPLPSPVLPGARVPYVPTACLLTRSDAIRAIKGFDESLRYGEDVDLVWRLPSGSVRFVPEIEALHRPRQTLTEFARQRFNYGSGAAGLAAKHGKAGAPVCLSPWSAALWGLILLRRPASAVAIFGYSIAALSKELDSENATKEAAQMVADGTGWSGVALAAAAVRAWWPLTLVALMSRRTRTTALVISGVGVLRRMQDATAGERVNNVVVGVVDDLAAGAGMWSGSLKHQSFACLLPDLEDRTEF